MKLTWEWLQVRTFLSTVIVVYVIIVGLVDGCYVVLLPILTASLMGIENSVLAWGFMIGSCSITFTIGPPAAGRFQSVPRYLYVHLCLSPMRSLTRLLSISTNHLTKLSMPNTSFSFSINLFCLMWLFVWRCSEMWSSRSPSKSFNHGVMRGNSSNATVKGIHNYFPFSCF